MSHLLRWQQSSFTAVWFPRLINRSQGHCSLGSVMKVTFYAMNYLSYDLLVIILNVDTRVPALIIKSTLLGLQGKLPFKL